MTDSLVRASLELAIDPAKAFEVLVEELVAGLAQSGIEFDPTPGGDIREGEVLVGRVVLWEPGERVRLEWHSAEWEPGDTTFVELRLKATAGGARATIEHRGWGAHIGDAGELTGWFANQVAAPLLTSMAPAALGDWITERRARRPSGAPARAIYADPLYHYPNFRVLLEELALTPEDHLLEVGCGGGALLKTALESDCRAAAIDHSPDMVQLARKANREAVAAGRLEVHEASADELPFADATFTRAVMTGVLGFLPDPVAAFRDIHRVLQEGGLFVSLGSDARLRGTPAAPEPMASRLRFYEEDELAALARAAGFDDVRVIRRELLTFAREAGIPEEHLPLFEGPGEQFLLARRTR